MPMVRDGQNAIQTPVNGTRACKLSTCRTPFEPKKANQEFCRPECKKEFHSLAYKKGEALMASKGIRAARIGTSPRLQAALRLLEDYEWHSSMEIAIAASTVAPGTTVQELKANGYAIESRCEKRTANNRPLWEYRLIRKAA